MLELQPLEPFQVIESENLEVKFSKCLENLPYTDFWRPLCTDEGKVASWTLSFLTVPGKQLQPGRIFNPSSTTSAALHSLSILASRSSVLFQTHLATHIVSTFPGILCLFSLLGLLVPLGGALASIRFTDILVFYVVSKSVVLLHPSLYTKISTQIKDQSA